MHQKEEIPHEYARRRIEGYNQAIPVINFFFFCEADPNIDPFQPLGLPSLEANNMRPSTTTSSSTASKAPRAATKYVLAQPLIFYI
jgi:hypothetical protein